MESGFQYKVMINMKDCLNLLHLYLGCNIRVKIEGIWTNWTVLTGHYLDLIKSESCEAEAIELQLRHISSMTEEEGYMIENEMRTYSPKFNYPTGCTHFDNVDLHEISYLLTVLRKHSFDCDNLIQNGLAIEIETINNKQ